MKNRFCFRKQGEIVAAPNVTLIDDGTMVGEWGRFVIDDEGNPANQNVLIENGILMITCGTVRARKHGRTSSGNAEIEPPYLPMVRMTNTFLVGREENPQEIIADTEYGVYVAQLGGDKSIQQQVILFLE